MFWTKYNLLECLLTVWSPLLCMCVCVHIHFAELLRFSLLFEDTLFSKCFSSVWLVKWESCLLLGQFLHKSFLKIHVFLPLVLPFRCESSQFPASSTVLSYLCLMEMPCFMETCRSTTDHTELGPLWSRGHILICNEEYGQLFSRSTQPNLYFHPTIPSRVFTWLWTSGSEKKR